MASPVALNILPFRLGVVRAEHHLGKEQLPAEKHPSSAMSSQSFSLLSQTSVLPEWLSASSASQALSTSAV
jgi:hypothetical protein